MAIWQSESLFARVQIPHQGSVERRGASIEFAEGQATEPDWHILRLDLGSFLGVLTEVRIGLNTDRCARHLYLGKNGGRDLAFVDMLTGEADAAGDSSVEVKRLGDLTWLTIQTEIDDGFLLIGGCTEDGARMYPGTGERVLSIASISALEATDRPRPSLTVLDVGASGGPDSILDPYANHLAFVLVEPDPVAAAELRHAFAETGSFSVIQAGLAGENGARTLNITAARACSSLLEPNPAVLSRYAVAPLFAVAERISVDCKRYDALAADGAPVPDFIKLDTQGTELEILRGFGDLLGRVSGIKLEAHFYPIYRGQPSISEIVAYLDRYGFALREMSPCWSFDDDLVEVDCLFIRRIAPDTPDEVREKVAFLHDIFRLPERPLGAELARTVR